MTGDCFVDTNLLVYVRDEAELEKQPMAEAWLRSLWQTRRGRLSFQVLSEYYVTVTRRLSPGLEPRIARADVQALMVWRPVSVERTVMEGAWGIQDRFHLSWWDALIVSAAQKANCDYLLTEDLQNEQDLGGVTVLNPFITRPEEILV